jgi:hypothetical protein
MDKVKQFLEVARKHHFWILCGVAALVGLLVLMTSSGRLTAETTARKKEIEDNHRAVKDSPAKSPNETWTTGMGANTTAAREHVRSAWTNEYDKQKQGIFIWPKEVLGEDFIKDIASVEEGKKADLDTVLRERYLRTVTELARELPKIVDAEVAPDTAVVGAAPMNPMPPVDANGNPILVDHKVNWDPASQQAIFETFTWFQAPSTTIVRQAQEELWVYEGLCKVIRDVNKNAKGSHDAPISGIHELAIAYQAHSGLGTGGFGGTTRGVERVKGPAAGGLGEGARGPMAGPEGSAPGAGTPPNPKERCKGIMGGGIGRPALGGTPAPDAAAPAGGNPDDIWKGFRYVDETGKPLATGAEVDASALEFNLMPFLMRLTINPKEIDELLIACRNSTLPIEVREVDLLEGAGGTSAPSGPSMMPPRSGGGMRGEEGGYGGGLGGGHMPTPQMSGQGIPQPKTVQIEVRGVVYLMKKPDPAKLGITPPEGMPPVDGTTPGTPPAQTTPPTAAAPCKSEIRSTKYEINSNHTIQNSRLIAASFPRLDFVSKFGVRISNFELRSRCSIRSA